MIYNDTWFSLDFEDYLFFSVHIFWNIQLWIHDDTWNTCQSESNLRLKNKAELWQFLPVSAPVFSMCCFAAGAKNEAVVPVGLQKSRFLKWGIPNSPILSHGHDDCMSWGTPMTKRKPPYHLLFSWHFNGGPSLGSQKAYRGKSSPEALLYGINSINKPVGALIMPLTLMGEHNIYIYNIPSGYLTCSHGKSSFSIGKSS